MPTEIEIYCNYRVELRTRIDIARGLLCIGITQALPEAALAEIVFYSYEKS
jgi:hypothetical protein